MTTNNCGDGQIYVSVWELASVLASGLDQMLELPPDMRVVLPAETTVRLGSHYFQVFVLEANEEVFLRGQPPSPRRGDEGEVTGSSS